MSIFVPIVFATFLVCLNVTFENMGGAALYLPFNSAVWIGFSILSGVALWPSVKGTVLVSRAHIALFWLVVVLWMPFFWSWNDASLMALPRLLALIAGLVLFFGMAQLNLSFNEWWWVGFFILCGVLIQILIGFTQIFIFKDSGWLSFVYNSGVPRGVFQQRNVFASFVATGLALSGCLLLSATKKLCRGVVVVVPTLIPVVLYFNGSLTGFISCIVVVSLVSFYLFKKNKKALKIWSCALLSGLVVLALVIFFMASPSPRSAESIASNFSHRWAVYQHSFEMIMERPLAGWGYGRFQSEFIKSYAESGVLNSGASSVDKFILNSYFTHPHNELLFWGVEGGFIPFFAIIIFSLWFAWNVWKRSEGASWSIYFALLFPLVFHSMTELPFYHSSIHWLTFILIAAYVASKTWPVKKLSNPYTFSVKFFSFVTIPLLCIFMLTNIYSIYVVANSIRDENGYFDMTKVVNPFGMKTKLTELNIEINLSNALQVGDRSTAINVLRELEDLVEIRPTLGNLNLLRSGYEYLEMYEKSEYFDGVINKLYPQTISSKVGSQND